LHVVFERGHASLEREVCAGGDCRRISGGGLVQSPVPFRHLPHGIDIDPSAIVPASKHHTLPQPDDPAR